MPTAVVGPGVSPDDPAITARRVEFPGPAGALMAYFAHPRGSGPYPTVLVCHENQGLIEPTLDIARRYAKAGYAALAVDLLSRQGGADKFTEPAQRTGALGQTPAPEYVKDWQAGLKWAQEQSVVRKDRVGFTGFCFGGGITWLLILNTPGIRAAVPYYGRIPPEDELAKVPSLQTAVLGIYGGNDPNVNAGIPVIEEAMAQAGKTFEKIIYEGAPHAFFNDRNPMRYHEASAKDAWPKTLAWFDRYLRV
jgi:carboxymethylenebutenolidase